ncbi:hypothetical protein SAMN05216509_4595 [Pseudomonas sp. B10]|nr:hypothetical protein SAMN05216509_4595 [Pseudomonas sp. B10]
MAVEHSKVGVRLSHSAVEDDTSRARYLRAAAASLFWGL